MTYKIIQDSRETLPWIFPSNEVEVFKLEEGDYTTEPILNYEKENDELILRIERKASPAELALNLGKNLKTFEAEIERLSHYRWPVLLCEFPMELLQIFPKKSKVPKKLRRKVRVRGPYMMKKLTEFAEDYNLILIFEDNREMARQRAISFFNEVHNCLKI